MLRDAKTGDPVVVRIALSAGGTDTFHASRRMAKWSVFQFLRARRRWREASYREWLATAEPDFPVGEVAR